MNNRDKKIADLKLQGRSDSWIKSYMRGWDAAGIRINNRKKGEAK